MMRLAKQDRIDRCASAIIESYNDGVRRAKSHYKAFEGDEEDAVELWNRLKDYPWIRSAIKRENENRLA